MGMATVFSGCFGQGVRRPAPVLRLQFNSVLCRRCPLLDAAACSTHRDSVDGWTPWGLSPGQGLTCVTSPGSCPCVSWGIESSQGQQRPLCSLPLLQADTPGPWGLIGHNGGVIPAVFCSPGPMWALGSKGQDQVPSSLEGLGVSRRVQANKGEVCVKVLMPREARSCRHRPAGSLASPQRLWNVCKKHPGKKQGAAESTGPGGAAACAGREDPARLHGASSGLGSERDTWVVLPHQDCWGSGACQWVM